MSLWGLDISTTGVMNSILKFNVQQHAYVFMGFEYVGWEVWMGSLLKNVNGGHGYLFQSSNKLMLARCFSWDG